MSKTVYVGPTITGVATRNSVYEELPEALAGAIKANPYLGGLCVPIGRLSGARAASIPYTKRRWRTAPTSRKE